MSSNTVNPLPVHTISAIQAFHARVRTCQPARVRDEIELVHTFSENR